MAQMYLVSSNIINVLHTFQKVKVTLSIEIMPFPVNKEYMY